MRLHTSGNAAMWGYEAQIRGLPTWQPALSGMVHIGRVHAIALVSSRKRSALVDLLKRIGQDPAAATRFRLVREPCWMLAHDLYALGAEQRLFAWSNRAPNLIVARADGEAKPIGRVVNLRLQESGNHVRFAVVGEVVAVRAGSTAVVHASRLVKRNGQIRPHWSLCPSPGLYLPADVVEEPVTCESCASRMSASRTSGVVSDLAAKLPPTLRLEELPLRVRTKNGLLRSGRDLVSSLVDAADGDLRDIRNFGARSFEDLVRVLRDRVEGGGSRG